MITKDKSACVPHINSDVRADLLLEAVPIFPLRMCAQTSWHSLSLNQEDRIYFPVGLIIVL